MAFANGGHKGAFQTNFVSINRVNGSLGDAKFAVRSLERTVKTSTILLLKPAHFYRGDVHRLPLNGHFSSGKDFLHRSRNFWSNAITRDEGAFLDFAAVES
jgi:hypothetical protein